MIEEISDCRIDIDKNNESVILDIPNAGLIPLGKKISKEIIKELQTSLKKTKEWRLNNEIH